MERVSEKGQFSPKPESALPRAEVKEQCESVSWKHLLEKSIAEENTKAKERMARELRTMGFGATAVQRVLCLDKGRTPGQENKTSRTQGKPGR